MRTIILLRKQSFCNDTACLGSYNFTVKIKRHWPIPDQGERKKSKNLTDALKQLAESDGELACALIHDTFLVKAPWGKGCIGSHRRSFKHRKTFKTQEHNPNLQEIKDRYSHRVTWTARDKQAKTHSKPSLSCLWKVTMVRVQPSINLFTGSEVKVGISNWPKTTDRGNALRKALIHALSNAVHWDHWPTHQFKAAQ